MPFLTNKDTNTYVTCCTVLPRHHFCHHTPHFASLHLILPAYTSPCFLSFCHLHISFHLTHHVATLYIFLPSYTSPCFLLFCHLTHVLPSYTSRCHPIHLFAILHITLFSIILPPYTYLSILHITLLPYTPFCHLTHHFVTLHITLLPYTSLCHLAHHFATPFTPFSLSHFATLHIILPHYTPFSPVSHTRMHTHTHTHAPQLHLLNKKTHPGIGQHHQAGCLRTILEQWQRKRKKLLNTRTDRLHRRGGRLASCLVWSLSPRLRSASWSAFRSPPPTATTTTV